MKTDHPRLFNIRFFAGVSWSVDHESYCRNQTAPQTQQPPAKSWWVAYRRTKPPTEREDD
uniref:hypothetical protein n=1 Tax=Crenothrix polyspora TaxID=360316 RepID=UPI0011773FEB|nr:hypothetical protein [Crenothrix polyspora]